ncbi:MAG: helix-turn-helix transcriptional regulator [Thermoguttaceae bacterium]|nr:helix-turn-helix transcriptional regulator [Thermoguttaceae bacterium]
MLDANMIIANNIRAELEKENKNQSDLAKEIGVSKKTMSKIMSGARAIGAIELRRISECLNVTVGSLLKMPESSEDTGR